MTARTPGGRIPRLVAGLVAAGMLPFAAAAGAQESGAMHPPLLIASYPGHAAYVVDTSGRVVWQSGKMPGACQDAWLPPNNHVLPSGGNQVREVTANHGIVRRYEAPKELPVEIHNCQPLPGGGALVGEED